MVRRSPCEPYTKYLILRGRSNEQIKEQLLELELDFLTNKYVGGLRTSIKRTTPDPFYPSDRYHNPSQEFLHRTGVHGLFFETPAVKGAHRILRSPRAKELVETLSMAGVPPHLIADLLRRRLKMPATEPEVEAFLIYFWNLALVKSSDLKSLIENRHLRHAEEGKEIDDDEKRLFSLSRKSLTEDPRFLAAALPNSPASAMIAQARMGWLPSPGELARIVELTRFLSVSRALEAVTHGESERAANFMNVGARATDMLNSVVRPDDELRAELNKLALKASGTATVPLLSELQARPKELPGAKPPTAPMDFEPPAGDDGVEEHG